MTPNTGYYIAGITVDAVSSPVTSSLGQTVDFTNITANHNITATFAPNNYTLTVITNGQGSVTPSNGTYPYGTIVNLNATSANGWSFGGWSNDETSSTIALTMSTNQTITANFTQNSTSTPTPAPTSSATPTSTPSQTVNSSSTPTTIPTTKAKSPTDTSQFSLATMGLYLPIIAAAIILGAVIVGLALHRREPPNIIILK